MPSFADDMTLYCSHTSAALACSTVSAALNFPPVTGKQKVTVGCVYRPPSTPTEFWSALENVTEEIQGRSIILLGDLNVNSIDRSDRQYKHFSSLCHSLQLQEIVQTQVI